MRGVALTGAAAAVLTHGLGAQTLRGAIVDRETGAPVVGAIVSLVADSTRQWPVLTDGAGAFRLRADTAGTYRVRVDRVGFRPFVQELPVTLAAGAVLERTIRVPPSEARLATVQVTTSAACNAPGIRGQDAVRVWEQVRTALDGARLTARRSLVPLEMVLEESIDLESAGRDAGRRAERRPTRVWRTRSARTFGSPVGVDYPAQGFRLATGDSADYVLPDADVALSEGFLTSHCFRVVRSGGLLGRKRLGLAFAPLDTTRATFLRGTMWVDESSSRLDEVDFAYAVPFWPRRHPLPRGRILFAALEGGGWIVRNWTLRAPILDTWEPTTPDSAPLYHMATLYKRGRAVVLSDSADVPMPPAYVTGSVHDSVAGTPMAGASVLMLGREVATTDSMGRFAVRVGPLGSAGATIPVLVRDPMLARYGVPILEQTVSVLPGDTLTLRLAVPGVEGVLARACPALASARRDVALGTTALGALFVEVRRTPYDTAALDARAVWEWYNGERAETTWVADSVDAAGTVVVCPVPTDHRVTLLLRDARGERMRLVLPATGRRARRVVVEVPPRPTVPAAPPAPPSGSADDRS